MNNLGEESEHHQNDLTVINSLHNQSLQSNTVLKCEHPQWDIKPDPSYLQLQQDLAPDLSSDQQYQGNISIVFSKIYNGLSKRTWTKNKLKNKNYDTKLKVLFRNLKDNEGGIRDENDEVN